MKHGILALIGGLLAGILVGALAPVPERAAQPVPRPRPEPVEPVVTTVVMPCPDLVGDQEAELQAAWEDLESAEAEQLALQATLAELIGEPPSFDGYPEDMLPDTVEDTIAALLDPDVAELQWVDCSDAPCVAVLRLVGDDTSSVDTMRRAADPIRDALGSEMAWEWFGVAAGSYMTVPLAPTPQADAVHHRTDLREELIIHELMAAGLAQ